MLDQYQFHQMTLTWLEGASFLMDGGTNYGPVPRAVWGRYYPYNDNNQIPVLADPILIQYQDKNYLIDTSIEVGKLDQKMKRNLGIVSPANLTGSLNELNLRPEDIDVVLMTHMHNDHASGLTYMEAGQLQSRFPQAKIYMSQIEWEEVRNPNARTRNTYRKENWETIQDQVVTFDKEIELEKGIRMELTGGHSRGHAIVRLEQAGETLIHLADLLLTCTHTNPLWVGGVDDYPMDSIAAKEKLMPEALKGHYRFLFYHDPFYRMIEYSEDGKAIIDGLKSSHTSPLPITGHQDKFPRRMTYFA
ncbi:MBL fold metallo-hydrolase [Facklamia sp. DSM 111018]|uniref:MBL fold metallo-hydrolase n=1 Tax=Facklamia lactis TaxID=2749967 RepID=A0ABS0LNH9_9LACT|nr:MBL fold metallo-hydrolase [Facklamia lactis]MBG9985720.1 MBL fold metallo-hydrolase [Facklamia lactis]